MQVFEKVAGFFSRWAASARLLGFAGAGLVLAAPQGAQAKVAQVDARGFVIQHLIEVPADPEEVWTTLLDPATWWDSAHTWSGDAANLSIEPKAGGCFCELLPNTDSPRAAPRGSVEHMRVVYLERPRVLRMSGALGPLQSDAVTGTLTIQVKPGEGEGPGKIAGTRILLEYVVGGYLRRPMDKMAPAVDGMLGAQMKNLNDALGGTFAAAFSGPDAFGDESPESDAVSDAEGGEAPAGEAGEAAEGLEPGAIVPINPDGIEPLADKPPEGEAVGR